MAETIKGGAYQDADGKWTDANGKPLSSAQVQQFKQMQAEQEAEEPTPAAVPPQPVPAPVITETPQVIAVRKPPKRSSKSKGGG